MENQTKVMQSRASINKGKQLRDAPLEELLNFFQSQHYLYNGGRTV